MVLTATRPATLPRGSNQSAKKSVAFHPSSSVFPRAYSIYSAEQPITRRPTTPIIVSPRDTGALHDRLAAILGAGTIGVDTAVREDQTRALQQRLRTVLARSPSKSHASRPCLKLVGGRE